MRNIKEYIIDGISNTKLFEMAYDRKQFKEGVRGLVGQITENWCLLRYCTLSKKELSKEHWRSELIAHLSNIGKMRMKLDKTRALQEEFIKYPELNNSREVKQWITFKWFKEKLDIDDEITNDVIKDFSSYGVYDIIDLLSKDYPKNFREIVEYIKNI